MRLLLLAALVFGPAVLLAQRPFEPPAVVRPLGQTLALCGRFATFYPGESPAHYVCYTAAKPPVIDGVEDAVWKAAPWTEEFTDIEGDIRPAPTFKTRTKLLWDKEYLYIYA